MTILKALTANSDGLINCLRQPGQLLYQPQKYMREEFNLHINSCATRSYPAAETRSIVLHTVTLKRSPVLNLIIKIYSINILI